MTQLGYPAQQSSPSEHDHQPSRRGSTLARRRNVLVGAGIGAGLLAVGGVIGASFVKSPAQLAANTAPPAATVTTSPVVSQILTSSVQMRGVVYPATEYDVYATSPPESGGGSSSGNSGSGSSPLYISKLDVAAGDTAGNGEQLAEVDGQPMFALTGSVPAWRDLTPGESGPDVAELQTALGKLGYYDGGDTAGYFGAATQYAVELYYEHLGYPPPSDGGVPAADVVFLPRLPATVIAVNGAAGQQPGQPFLELAARGSLALTGELPPGYASQVKAGLKVTVYDEVTGLRATGTVENLGSPVTTAPAGAIVSIGGTSSASSSGSSNSSGSSGSSNSSGSSGSSGSSSSSSSSNSSGSSGGTPFVPLTVRPSKPLPAALNGENVLVTVETGQTEGPVLTVPVAAIVTTASGATDVTVAGAHGKQTEVPVTPGISENGYVQVTPATPGALKAGDAVVVSG